MTIPSGFSDLFGGVQQQDSGQAAVKPNFGTQPNVPTQPQASFPKAPQAGFWGGLLHSLTQGGANGRLNIGPAVDYLASPTDRAGVQAEMTGQAQQRMTAEGQQQAIAKQFQSDPTAPIAEALRTSGEALSAVHKAGTAGIEHETARQALLAHQQALSDYLAKHGASAPSQQLESEVQQGQGKAGQETGLSALTQTKAGEEQAGANKYGGVSPEVGLQERAQQTQAGQFTASQKQAKELEQQRIAEEATGHKLSALGGYAGIAALMGQNPEIQDFVSKMYGSGQPKPTDPHAAVAQGVHDQMTGAQPPPSSSKALTPGATKSSDDLMKALMVNGPEARANEQWGLDERGHMTRLDKPVQQPFDSTPYLQNKPWTPDTSNKQMDYIRQLIQSLQQQQQGGR